MAARLIAARPPDHREHVAADETEPAASWRMWLGQGRVDVAAERADPSPRWRPPRAPGAGTSAPDRRGNQRQQRLAGDPLVVPAVVRRAVAVEEHRVARGGVEVVLDDERRAAELGFGRQPRVALLLVAQPERDQRPVVVLEVLALRLAALLEVDLLGGQRQRRRRARGSPGTPRSPSATRTAPAAASRGRSRAARLLTRIRRELTWSAAVSAPLTGSNVTLPRAPARRSWRR